MRLRLTAFVALCLAAVAAGPILAATAADELTFSASARNPNEGDTTFQLNIQYLLGASGNFLIGPSVSMFDAGDTDGGLFGLTGKLRIGKKSGFWVGGRLQKPSGDAADQVEYVGDLLAGVDVGTEHAFATFYASQTYSREKSGATVDPDGTNFNAGLGWRF